ncbi:hypothetical protein LNKW23_25530 [Paralimibaculum aggregatum]|uniref:Cell division coordinator CpoB n=1 Tax=Paralimibaculum aggregatum TaxID=3036245 RepID=A0ABQ6LJ88_9RHOB|nr:tetratricopeptide repeat protein [Limibaculum sp. NKW23]GMG83340.1 hypothetical protein LNKW23_25530 [Limibaculum sp. NKW23]
MGAGVFARAAGLVVIGMLAALPAGAQQWTGSGDTVQDLRYRLGILDAEMADIRARLQALDGGAPAPRTGGGGSAGGGEALVRLDRLEAELGRLTGIVEQLEFQQRQIAEDAGRRFGDIDFRLTELEGGDVGSLAPPQPLGGQRQAAAPAPAPVPVAPAPRTGAGGGGRTDLDLAIADIQQGRFDQGEGRLERYLAENPGRAEAAEAQFWLGRSNFVRGSFAEAARRHLAGYNTDRQGPLAARNLLQLGVTLGRLGQVSEACLTLREVRNQFPNDREMINAADAERDSLACGS